MFAYTNKDVNALNEDLRAARRERGELSGSDVGFETKHGAAMFAVGDRVQFTDTRKGAKIYNGNVGTITSLDARTGLLHARLDGPQGAPGREVVWSASEFDGFRHGYAGTIYKGQGKTLDHQILGQCVIHVLNDLGRGHVEQEAESTEIDGQHPRTVFVGLSRRLEKRAVTSKAYHQGVSSDRWLISLIQVQHARRYSHPL